MRTLETKNGFEHFFTAKSGNSKFCTFQFFRFDLIATRVRKLKVSESNSHHGKYSLRSVSFSHGWVLLLFRSRFICLSFLNCSVDAAL